jgi:hypothetical protein
MAITFSLTVLAWVFFRAENIEHALQYIVGIFRHPGSFLLMSIYYKYKTLLVLIFIFLIIEWLGRENKYAIEKLGFNWKRPYRYAFYYIIIFAIIFLGGKQQQFIYFQF